MLYGDAFSELNNKNMHVYTYARAQIRFVQNIKNRIVWRVLLQKYHKKKEKERKKEEKPDLLYDNIS